MRAAFFAPLKPPDHPVPSGDRTMARGLLGALDHAGWHVDVPSRLRIYDKSGDALKQAELTAAASAEVARVLAHPNAPEWRIWITYHNYYKSPDLIGPEVAKKLGIPYVLIEATRAKKRLTGPWSRFATAAEAASDAAGLIFYLTRRDAETLDRDAPPGQRLAHLPPFLPQCDLPPESQRGGAMLTVAMMRAGDKLASYELIAETLALLDGDWRLDIAGDGPARADVTALMAPFGPRVRFLGQLDAEGLRAAYAQAGLVFWPGVNEAFGLVYLEAQAAGLPVVAQDRPGVRDVVHCPLVACAEGPQGMARHLKSLFQDNDLRTSLGKSARAAIAENHLLSSAAETLTREIGALL